MDMTQHDGSSLISHHGYDPETKTMAITLRTNNSTYHYQNVGQSDYDTMLAADSIGSHIQKVIKPNFAHRKTNV
jgi:hypothetical protein